MSKQTITPRLEGEYDLGDHGRFVIGEEFIFFCLKMKEAYTCHHDFNYCPSCGVKIENTDEVNRNGGVTK